jgi:cold shock CspA family protein
VATGRIRWVHENGGYGFIRPDDFHEPDLFVGRADTDGGLTAGQRVEYRAVPGARGPRAVNVRRLRTLGGADVDSGTFDGVELD